VLDTLTDLVSRAKTIPVWLDPLARLEALVSDVQAWKESATKTFLMKNSPYSLLEVNYLQQSSAKHIIRHLRGCFTK
jgi:histone demethylase JARID1